MSTRPAAAKAYPWHALERTTRAQADALRRVRRWADAHAEVPRLKAVLAELLDVEVDAVVQRAEPLSAPRGIPGGAGVVVAGVDAPGLERGMLVEVEVALLATAVARVARRKAPAVLGAGTAASVPAAGALAAIVVAALRRAHAGVAMRVVAAGPAEALEADVARLGQELVAVTLTVLVANEAYEVRLVVPRSAALASPSPAWDAAALARMGAVPLPLAVVAVATLTTAADVALLRRGDVWVLEGWALRRTADGALAGPVSLAAPASTAGVAAELHEDGRLVLGGQEVPLCAAEAVMSEAIEAGSLIEAVGEVPVVLRVEIGEARMAAREWAALARGDVVTLGRRVGEAVVLRVGGVVVARGDLVEVEGEVGVRIVERLGEAAARR